MFIRQSSKSLIKRVRSISALSELQNLDHECIDQKSEIGPNQNPKYCDQYWGPKAGTKSDWSLDLWFTKLEVPGSMTDITISNSVITN